MIFGDLPPTEAFPIGGTNSVRGYAEGAVGSARHFATGHSELRFPVSGPFEVRSCLQYEFLRFHYSHHCQLPIKLIRSYAVLVLATDLIEKYLLQDFHLILKKKHNVMVAAFLIQRGRVNSQHVLHRVKPVGRPIRGLWLRL